MNGRFLICYTFLACYLVSASSAHAARYALVIGVNECPQFRFADSTQPRPLRGAESDAQAMAKLLQDQFAVSADRLHLLLGPKATRKSFREIMDQLARHLTSEDLLVFYFAGHGTQVRDQQPLDEADRLDEALCLADATAAARDLILDDEIGEWIERLRTSKITVIFDCCHAGSGTKDALDDLAARHLTIVLEPPLAKEAEQSSWADLQPVTKSLEPKVVIALFACQSQQQAYERRFADQVAPARSGQFTRYLAKALQNSEADTNADRLVSPEEAHAWISRELDRSFNEGRQKQEEKQQPAWEGPAKVPSLF